jgi:ribosomal protein L34E
MDRAELSAEIIDELGRVFEDTLRRNAEELVASDFDGIEQRLQTMSRTVLGRVVEQTIAVIAEVAASERPNCQECHQPMRLVDRERPRMLQGLVGDYAISRPYYLCDRCHEGRAPLDEHLGLGVGALSPGLQRVACRLGIADSFGDAVDALRETLRIELATEADRRITEGIGQVAEDEAQALIARAQAGKEPFPKSELPKSETPPTSSTLLVEVDGALVHEIDGQWHEVKSGLAAPLGPKVHEDKETGRSVLAMGKPSYCAGFESAEAFWYRIYVEACRRGLGTAMVTLCVVLGDGAEWIWHYATAFLAVEVGPWRVKVIEILDIYHAFEHLGKVAEVVFGQASEAAKEWVEPLRRRLEEEGVGPILEALGALTPAEGEPTEEVRKALAYFKENASRMDYPTYLALKLPIGSGAIESACKTLIEEREKGAGMRWSQQGAQAVATLRALHRSGRWDSFWKRHPQRCRPAVNPRRPHSTATQEPARQAA